MKTKYPKRRSPGNSKRKTRKLKIFMKDKRKDLESLVYKDMVSSDPELPIDKK